KFGLYWVWAIGLFVALLTAFYMFRLMGLTFWGEFRGPKELWDKIHESPRVMTMPLILLAIPSVLLGIALGLPFGHGLLLHWLDRIFADAHHLLVLPREPYALFGIDGVLSRSSVAVAAIGVALAWRFSGVDLPGVRLGGRPEQVRELPAKAPFLYRGSLNKW